MRGKRVWYAIFLIFALIFIGRCGGSEQQKDWDDLSMEIIDFSNFGKTVFPGHYPGMWENFKAFAALKEDGSVVTWGGSDYGGDSSLVADELH